MSFNIDNRGWGAWEMFSQAAQVTLTPGDGTKRVAGRVRDTMGFVSPAASDNVVLDTLPPAVSDGYPRRGSTIPDLSFVFSAYAYDQHMSSVSASVDGQVMALAWQGSLVTSPVTLGEGAHDVLLTAEDSAGNQSVLSWRFYIMTASVWTPPEVTEPSITLEPVTETTTIGEPIRLTLTYANPYSQVITDTMTVEVDGVLVYMKNLVIPPAFVLQEPVTIRSYPPKERVVVSVYGANRDLWVERTVALAEPAPEFGRVWLLIIGIVAVISTLIAAAVKKTVRRRVAVVYRHRPL
jgi:hypothetical protein